MEGEFEINIHCRIRSVNMSKPGVKHRSRILSPSETELIGGWGHGHAVLCGVPKFPTCEPKVAQTLEEMCQRYSGFHAGQRCSQARVDPMSKGNVWVGI